MYPRMLIHNNTIQYAACFIITNMYMLHIIVQCVLVCMLIIVKGSFSSVVLVFMLVDELEIDNNICDHNVNVLKILP